MSEQDRIAQLQEEIARRAAQAEEAPEDTAHVLVFLLAGERYAFPLAAVREICRVRPITPLPGLPPSVLGAAGLRGEVLPVIEMRRLLALPETPLTDASRMVIVHHEGTTAALLADQVEDIAALPQASISPPPAGDTAALLQGIAHEGERITRLLDLPRLLEAIRHGQ